MKYVHTFLVSLLTLPFLSSVYACKGCVSLDEYNFEKIITRFKAVLVKFDVAFPYGDKHDQFTKLAEEIIHNDDILLAQVGIKNYGEKDNELLGEKYQVKGKDAIPSVQLFLGSTENPIKLTESLTTDNLKDLIRDNTNIYLGLPGCLENYDKLASEFVLASDKEAKLKEIEELSQSAVEKEKSTVVIYLKFMKKVIEEGISFIQQEHNRLKKILKGGKVNNKKKEELTQRLNILHAFKVSRDEL